MTTAPFAPDALVLDGRFRILRRLGAGGMGEVYLAQQVSLRRKVALKVLRQDMDLLPGATERFHREALLLSSVDHPAVVRVIDFGETGGAPCLVMELAEGEPLDVTLGRGPLPPARAVPLLIQLAEGLAAIHEKGIVHRDLKPDNVILGSGPRGEQARLLDFGIARLVEPDPALGVTQTNLVLGTPEYLSPEQALGLPLDGRSDLYSLGVMAFRILTGELPFRGPSAREFMAQHASQPAPRPDAVVSALREYPALSAVVMRCLEKDPSRRYTSGQELARALAEPDILRPVPSVAPPVPAWEMAPAASTAIPEDRIGTPPGSNTIVYGTPPPDVAPPGGRATTPGEGGAPAHEVPPGPGAPPPVSTGTIAYGTPAPAAPPASPNPDLRRSGEISLRRSGEMSRLGALFTGSNAAVGRTQNLTVMLTDIAGFTERTSRQTREQNARMMREHDRVLLPIVRAFGGKVLQKRGDALLIVFKSPTESVLCGMALQDGLWRYNSTQPESDYIPVRVAIHVGEVLVHGEALVGEPVKIVEAVEEVTQSGEVVFTEAVRLSMNKAEAQAEEYGVVGVPGRAEQLRLYRCVAAAEGPPFGGRDQGLRRTLTGELPAVRELAKSIQSVPGMQAIPRLGAKVGPLLERARGLDRRAIAAVIAVVLLVGVTALAAVLWYNAPARRIRRLLDGGEPQRAFQIAEGACAAGCLAELRSLQAAALHDLKRHKEEQLLISGLMDAELVRMDPRALAALIEDFGRNERDAIVRAQLARAPSDWLLPELRRLASGPRSPAQWGALRYLDVTKTTEGLDLPALYAAALEQDDCRARAVAARRLGELGSDSARPALSRLATTPKQGESCGQDEAAAALRKLDRR